jgi:hypothetical protein
VSTSPTYRRVVRRETYSPRSTLAIVIAVVVIVLCLYVGVEIVLQMLQQRALLAAPDDMIDTAGRLQRAPTAAVVGIGIGLIVIGLIVIIAAVKPGRRARHQMAASRAAVVVDNEVVASALARTASHVGGVSPDNVLVTVSARRSVVNVTPTSGRRVSENAIDQAVGDALDSFELTPAVRHSIAVSPHGKVGA